MRMVSLTESHDAGQHQLNHAGSTAHIHSKASPKSDLPPRESQVLCQLLAGRSEKEVALELGISPHTVHVYVKALYRRFNASSRAELMSLWVNSVTSAAVM